jgi:hypothetical protein
MSDDLTNYRNGCVARVRGPCRSVAGRGVYRYLADEQILQVKTDDLDATVRAGVTHEQLNSFCAIAA